MIFKDNTNICSTQSSSIFVQNTRRTQYCPPTYIISLNSRLVILPSGCFAKKFSYCLSILSRDIEVSYEEKRGKFWFIKNWYRFKSFWYYLFPLAQKVKIKPARHLEQKQYKNDIVICFSNVDWNDLIWNYSIISFSFIIEVQYICML